MTLCALLAAAEIGGVFPLLCTPYSEDGSLDCETLAKEARFVADCGADGVRRHCRGAAARRGGGLVRVVRHGGPLAGDAAPFRGSVGGGH